VKKIFKDLAKLPPKVANKLTLEAHNEVFSQTDCLQCARCCKGYSPIVTEDDVYRIADHLQMEPGNFASKYLILDEDDEWCINGAPCPFLLSDNTCSIYAWRPASCADYPHTSAKNLHKRADITLVNADICPAVPKILQIIQQKMAELS
jgi:Fe-S-cluster containining protein